jgi:hypothetical protein
VAHGYDAPNLTARTFLLAVMHDHHTPLHTRIDAAHKLLPIMHDRDYVPDPHAANWEVDLTYRIETKVELR